MFYFSDSLYNYLEKAEGYALEIDLNEFMDSAIQKVVEQKVDELIDKKRMSRAGEKKKIIDSLIQNVKASNDKASKRQLEKIRSQIMKKALKNKEMPTVMDAYLYGIARRQGKWLGGIEDVHDQMALMDEFGTEIDADDFNASDKEINNALEQMIALYLAKDLKGIEEFATGHHSDKLEDALFLNRNVKMARRMDSLSRIRSMFFTVGAAHLPGDSGVIKLLRQRGFQVDPVFSASLIDPDTYTAKLAQVPWIPVEDDRKTYKVEMPGKPSDLNMFGEAIRMKFYIDITTLTYFMSGSTITQKEINLEKIMKQLSVNSDAKVLSKRLFEKNGVKGLEGVLMTSDDVYYKAQYLVKDNMLYILLAGGERKESTESADAKKFFNSFVINKIPVRTADEWSVFELKDKGIKVDFPGIPKRNLLLERKAEGSGWTFLNYEFMDMNSSNYYMLQVRDIRPGYFLEGDSIYFSLIRDNLKTIVATPTKDSIYTLHGFPALHYEGKITESQLPVKSVTIARGNRVYSLFVVSSVKSNVDADLDRFFNSMVFTEYQKPEWRKEVIKGGNFSTTSPSSITLKDQAAEDETDPVINYEAYNKNDCVSYNVRVEPMSQYYWAANDSAFFDEMGSLYKRETDSIISSRWVTNGRLKGKEWIMYIPGATNVKHLRQVLNGDTLYSVMSFVPREYIDQKDHRQFYDEFRIINERTESAVYTSKAKKILENLRSADTLVFSEAVAALGTAVFAKDDRPLLHQAFLHHYIDDTVSQYVETTTRDKLLDAIGNLSDSSTVDFIRTHYAAQPDEIRFDLLEVLANYRNSYSYDAIKELVLANPPRKRKSELSIASWTVGAPAAIRLRLYPEILRLTNNKEFALDMSLMNVAMLDSNMISLDLLRPYQNNILHTADTIVASLQNDDWNNDRSYRYTSLLNLLKRFNDVASNNALRKFFTVKQTPVKYKAALALLDNKQPVTSTELESIAADRYYHRDLYDTLKNLGRLDIFPVKYLTQQYKAESDVYNAIYDEVEPAELILVKKITQPYKGQKKVFYLYKVTYGDKDGAVEDKSTYLAVAGPYSIDIKNLDSEGEETGGYYEEELSSKNIDKLFKEYLKRQEDAQ